MSMIAPGTVAFDMIGTCFNLNKPKQRLVELGLPTYALQLWFAQTLRDAFALSHAGGYQPLNQMLEAELPRTLKLFNVEIDPERQAHVLSAFNELELETGALEAFQRLTEAGWRLVALTNGGIESTHNLLEKAGALPYFADSVAWRPKGAIVRSCDEIQITKPHQDVYQLLGQNASGEIWMIAAHAWDIAGAIRAGLKTAFITSSEGSYLSAYPQPDVMASGLIEAVNQILGK
ncbi:HAD family hydrolase [Capilliphycus salinus ALCB114379]|uniref:HAD family hydrolase n=1 Tax=Capilliphycus salinus TaxID=2768948 RepID=UPI0039A5839B